MIHQTYVTKYILLLELDNPPANTLAKAMKLQMMKIMDEVEQNKLLRAIIITGKGTKFCSGDDLKEAAKNVKTQNGIIQNLQDFSAVIDRFEAIEIPIIAAINGWCIGGGLELALCCDIRVAVSEAKFVSAGVNVGLTASAYRLPRLIGIGRAKRLLLTGDSIDAKTALNYGLITDIFEHNLLLAKAIEIAKTITTKAPLAIKSTKKIANKSLDLAYQNGLKFQQEQLELLSKTNDHKIALEAFLEKQKPKFKGK
ncbi:MAG: enoyl-CoA hydratase/isomerase family protein [Saprospiraceae bacterium]